ncbi:hypothetical protein AAY473_004971 [Plecturocebus cupreus]
MRSPASARPEPGSSGRERGRGGGGAGGGGGRARHSHSRRALAASRSRGRPSLEGRETNQRARGERNPPRGALIGPARATQLQENGSERQVCKLRPAGADCPAQPHTGQQLRARREAQQCEMTAAKSHSLPSPETREIRWTAELGLKSKWSSEPRAGGDHLTFAVKYPGCEAEDGGGEKSQEEPQSGSGA